MAEIRPFRCIRPHKEVASQVAALPLGGVWDEYLARTHTAGSDWYNEVRKYEENVLSKRN